MNRTTWIIFGSALAACTSSSSQPTPEQYDDTAQAIASTTATSGGGGDVASMADTVTISLGAMPAGFSLTGNGHFHGNRLGIDYDSAFAGSHNSPKVWAPTASPMVSITRCSGSTASIPMA